MPEPEVLLTAKRFTVIRKWQQLRSGDWHSREIVQHPGAVVILPLLPDGHVCLIRNERIAVGQKLIELPAGTLEPNEDPRNTALRELVEETGYSAGQIEELTQFFMSPGILNERMYLFLATELTAGESALEAGEEIESLIVPWDEAIRMCLSGEIQDSKTLCGLLFYDRLRNR